MKLRSTEEVLKFTDDAEKSYDSMRAQLAERQGIDGCYYEQVQWIGRSIMPGVDRTGTITRLRTDWNPDSRSLRITENETTRLTQKAAASTHPGEIYMAVEPPERDTGPDAAYRARVHETVVNTAIASSNYLPAAQAANHGRSIFGTRLLGLAIEHSDNGAYVCAYSGDTTCLILEPSCQHLDLHEHPFVMYQDIWTLDRIEKVLGVKIDPKRARTFEQLDPQKIELNALSNNKLFTRFARYATTKGARVYQLHTRDGRERFDDWFVVVEIEPNKKQLVNDNDTSSPFGGRGMPFAILHGYHRADTMWSWGEPAQIMEDQNKANLRGTMRERIHQQYAHARPIVDRRWFGSAAANDDSIINGYFNNQIGLPIIGSGSDRARNAQPPAYLPTPPPPPFLDQDIQVLRETMRDKTHKAPGNFGVAKTHVPDATNQRVLDDADQVSSVRLDGDVRAHNYLTSVLHATTIKLVQARNAPTIAMLRAEGLDAQDFSVLLEADATRPGTRMYVKEGSFRNVSTAARKQNLDNAASMGMIDGPDYQQAMAETLQLPLTNQTREMTDKARKAALRIISGETWVPIPLGRWNKVFIESFQTAQLENRVLADPAARQRLVAAIQSQYGMQYQEQILANPELAAQMQAAQQAPAGEESSEQESEGPQPGDTASVADVIAALSRGGSGAGASVPASAA